MAGDGRDKGPNIMADVCIFSQENIHPCMMMSGMVEMSGRTSVAAQSCAGSLLRHTMLAHPLTLTFQVGQVVAVVLVVATVA